MLFCGAKHRHKHSLFLCWPFPSCWGRAGIDTDKILKITRTSGAFDCNQCNLAHNSYICLPKILRWRIHGCRHIFGLWKKLYLGIGGHFTFIGQKYLWLGVCHIHDWVICFFKIYLRPPNAKSNVWTLAKKWKSSMGFLSKF